MSLGVHPLWRGTTAGATTTSSRARLQAGPRAMRDRGPRCGDLTAVAGVVRVEALPRPRSHPGPRSATFVLLRGVQGISAADASASVTTALEDAPGDEWAFPGSRIDTGAVAPELVGSGRAAVGTGTAGPAHAAGPSCSRSQRFRAGPYAAPPADTNCRALLRRTRDAVDATQDRNHRPAVGRTTAGQGHSLYSGGFGSTARPKVDALTPARHAYQATAAVTRPR